MQNLRFYSNLARHMLLGIKATQDFIENDKKMWSLKTVSQESRGTSLSDNDEYTSIVSAALEQGTFDNFRTSWEYTDVLEHVGLKLGRSYAKRLSCSTLWGSIPFSDFASTFSSLGNPPTYRVTLCGREVKLSLSLLRYLFVAQDIESRFGTLDKRTICEIGVGFGGQASVILNSRNVSRYTMFDLPTVLSLASKFVDAIAPKTSLELLDGRNPKFQSSDLVVSNYAISEVDRHVQELYLSNVVSQSDRGYITWNRLGEEAGIGMTAEEFAAQVPGSSIEAENPLSFRGNVLITWG